MEIQLICIGKTNKTFWSDAIKVYEKRINNYTKFSITYISDIRISKKTREFEIKAKEIIFIFLFFAFVIFDTFTKSSKNTLNLSII